MRTRSFPQASVDIDIEVSSSSPSVGEKVDLVLTVMALDDYPDAIVELLLPSGVEYVSGDLTWAGGLLKGEEKTLTATIRALEDGVWEIVGKMIAFEGDVDRIGNSTNLHLLVGDEAPKLFEARTRAMEAFTNPEQTIIEIVGSVATGASVGPASPGTVTIRGNFGVYECRCDPIDDNNCPCSPCTGNSCVSSGGASHLHGIPYMLVEAWDDDVVADDLIASTYTNVNGYYNFANIDNADGEGGTNEWYLKFIVLGWPGFQTGYTWVQSIDLSKDWTNAYWGTTNIGNLADGTVYDVGWTVFTDSRKAHILYAVMKACYWMYYHAYAWDMPTVVIYYPATTSRAWSSFEIEIAGPPKHATWDHAMDDDVSIHEYGHCLMWYFYDADPRGGCTIATEGCIGSCGCTNHGGSTNDCSCDGIFEGWANFFAAIVPEEWNTRDWDTDRYVVDKDAGVYRDHESNAIVHEYHEMTFARILWDIVDPIEDGETVQVPFEKGATASDYDENPIWWEMTRQNPANEHAYQEEPYTIVEFWIFWLETFPYGATTAGEADLCNVYSLHGVTRDFTNRCSASCYGYCDGQCDFCVPNCADDPCGGAGCPGVGCVSVDCTEGWCDADSPSQGCNGSYPDQCNCYGNGMPSICSNADPSTTCVEGCWINPCVCSGADCPSTGCYNCGYATIPDWCDCGNNDCVCGHENDCASFTVDNYVPCGGTTAYDFCDCGHSSCTCGYEFDCQSGIDDYMPCGGASVNDWCDCGAADCTCGFQVDCINGVNNYMPCEGVTVKDYCNCGFADCNCEPQFECVYGIPGNFLGACGGVSVDDPCNCNGADCPCPPQVDCANGILGNWQPCAGVISCECGGVGCGCPDSCSLAPPSPGGWILLATDPDEGFGTSLKEINGQLYSGVIYFMVEHYRPWTTITDIDTGILIDADQNPGTGLPDGYYPGQVTGIGADYMILVGWEATVMFRWVGSWWDLANPIPLAYLDAPNGASVFVVGVYLADVATVGALDCAVFDVNSGWDWMPDIGYFTLPLPAWMPCGGLVSDTCDCGGIDCNCGSESDCAAFTADNFMPCGGITPCECGGVGCGCPDSCSLAPPSPGGWILLATDPDEGFGTSLKEINGQLYSGVIYFMVEHYRPWTTITDIDTAILIDADQNPGTGQPGNVYPGQNTGIGADYLIIVGWEGTAMWRWVGFWDTANPIALAYLDAPDGASVFVVGVYLADVVTVGALDCAVTDVVSNWDWMPDIGYFTLPLPAWMPCGGTVPDWCDCLGADCTCGYEDDCAAFAVDDYLPCGGATVNDTCDCGGADCTCGFEVDCLSGVDDYMPCGGVTVEDWCDCGYPDCTCGYELDCVNGVDDYWLPGDANRDRVVDLFDAATISAHWYPGPPIGPLGYDPIADLNDDGRVDIFDAATVNANWGRTCSPG